MTVQGVLENTEVKWAESIPVIQKLCNMNFDDGGGVEATEKKTAL